MSRRERREIIMFSGRTFCNTTLSNANTVDKVYKYPKKLFWVWMKLGNWKGTEMEAEIATLNRM